MARRIHALLDEYGESHQNPTNKAVHWVCVPVIVWTVMVFVYAIPQPGFMAAIGWLNWLTLALALSLLYYVILSPTLAVGFALYAGLCYWLTLALDAATDTPVWQIGAVIFVLAWVGQFWGHKVEGKKPSFFEDIQYLMIGPAWIMGFLYRKWGIKY